MLNDCRNYRAAKAGGLMGTKVPCDVSKTEDLLASQEKTNLTRQIICSQSHVVGGLLNTVQNKYKQDVCMSYECETG